uniref:Luc7-like protein 3 n=1 Tax=Acrobeloides nanus TaxID=290746 RepID=A0A914E2L0_9BILA
MTDMMREMIAEMMGSARAEEEGRKLVPYDHHSVCRAYLLDCCPREILTDTRLESFIPCRKVHEPAHKADYQRAQAKKEHFYDVEAFEALEDAVRIIDMEVEKTKEKVKKDADNQSDSQEFIKTQKIFDLNEKIGTTLHQVEKLGNEGKVEESMQLSKSVEELKRKKRELELEVRAMQPSQQRLRVCEACGAQLNILDHESRLADHYGGKMHLGMVEIREKFEKMKKNVEQRRKERREEYEKDRSERRGESYDRERGQHDRDRYGDRERRRYDDDRDRRRDRSRSPRRSRRSRSRSPSRKSSGSSRRDSSRERRRY